MSQLSAGIVGLPNVGKSTLFKALTRLQAEAANYPFCTIDPNVGTVELKDERLQELARLSHSEKIIYATMQFVDIAGLVKGAASGEGLGNKFLANIRETQAIIHVVRCFEDGDITHVQGKVDPLGDIEVIDMELILADLQNVDNILIKLEKRARVQKEGQPLVELLKKVQAHLNTSQPLRTLAFTEEQQELLKPYNFITSKKVIYVANIGDEDIQAQSNAHVQALRAHATEQGLEVVVMCAQVEAEIASMEPEDEQEFLQAMGLKESGLQQLIKKAFNVLDLMTFMTSGPMESRAWTVNKNTPANEAAGKIHTDIQKGFIRAEVISYKDFVTLGGRNPAKEAGKMRSEGKEYLIQDGDVVLFLHN